METALFAFYVLSVLSIEPYQYGIIMSSSFSASIITSAIGGSAADWLGRKKTLLIAILLMSLGYLSLAFSGNWILIAIVYALILGSVHGSTPAFTAIVYESVRKEKLGAGLGLLNAAESALIGLGAFLAAIVAQRYGFHALFLLIGIMNLIAMIPILRIKTKNVTKREERKRVNIIGLAKALKPNRSLFFLSFAVFIVSVGGYASMFYPYHVQENFDVTSVHMGIFDSVYFIVWTITNYPAGWLSDRIGRKKVIIVGYLLAGIAWAAFPMVENLLWLYVLYGLYSVGNSMGFFATALAMDVVTEERKSTAVGFLNSCVFFGIAVSGIIGGMLWERMGDFSFYLPLPVYAISLAIIIKLVK